MSYNDRKAGKLDMLRDIERENVARKTTQPTGSTDIHGIAMESSNQYDVDVTIPAGASRSAIFTFTADRQNAPAVGFKFDVWINGNVYRYGTLQSCSLTYRVYSGSAGSPNNKMYGVVLSVYNSGSSSATYRIKYKAIASDTGKIAIEVR